MAEDPKRAHVHVAQVAEDNIVLPFRTVQSGVIGRIVRLGSVVDTVLGRHDYPEAVSRVLGEALALSALLGSSMRPHSRLTLQTKGDGPIKFLVVNYEMPGHVRGYASVATERFEAASTNGRSLDEAMLLGHGLLAMTIDPGGDSPSHQGIVALDGGTLQSAAMTYFRQSEQLPTVLRLVVARHYAAASNGGKGTWTWRAGGLLVQHVASERVAIGELSQDEAEREAAGERDEDWSRVRMLAETVEDHELIDPTLSAERLLYRLFHEEGVSVTPAHHISEYCRCSQERVEAMMKSFDADDVADMREADGGITVTCEFCNTKYRLEPEAQG